MSTNLPVNLNKARKAKARADKRARADENVAKFGRSKPEKLRDADALRRAHSHVDGHKREE